jgi:glycerol kinase
MPDTIFPSIMSRLKGETVDSFFEAIHVDKILEDLQGIEERINHELRSGPADEDLNLLYRLRSEFLSDLLNASERCRAWV